MLPAQLPANTYRNLSCEMGIMGTLTPQAGSKIPEVPRECSVSQEEPPRLVTHGRGEEDSVGQWGWIMGLETSLISLSPSKTLKSDNHQPLPRGIIPPLCVGLCLMHHNSPKAPAPPGVHCHLSRRGLGPEP